MYRPVLRHIAFYLAAICWPAGALALTSIDQPKNLSLTAQPLSSALISLGKSSGVSIVFPSRLIGNSRCEALQGKLSTRQALEALLAQTQFSYREISPHVIAIIPKPNQQDPLYHDNLTFEELTVIGRSVTGSRLSRNDLEGSSPVDVISAPDLARSGTQSLAEFLKFVPAVSGNSTSTAVSNGGDGTATVTLRGLPANNTLVLVNGQRVSFDGMAGDSVDLNTISPASVERIEILKDGASAIYGSDAIAGVVNIVMKQEFEGFQIEQYYGESSHGDLETLSTNLLWGHSSEQGGLIASFSYYTQEGLFSRDRNLSNNADGRSLGGSDQRTSATESSRITLGDGSVVMLDDGIFRNATDEDLHNYRTQTSSISPSDRFNFYTSGYYQFNDRLKFTGELAYNQTEATITLASTPLYTAFEDIPLPVAADNIYNPFGEELSDIRRRVLELEPREQINDSQGARINLGLQGNSDHFNWEGHVYWSRNESEEKSTNLLNANRLSRALGPSANCQGTSIDGCEPLNLFGPAGSISETQLAYIRDQVKEEGYSQLYGMNFTFDSSLSELPDGALQLVAGIDFRREESSIEVDYDLGESFVGGTPVGETKGARSIYEAFFELQAPIAKNTTGIYSLDAELALRQSYYSDFGSNSSPKLGLRYRPIRDLLIRTTYSEGFRAPSIDELHMGGHQTQAFLDDPCSLPENIGVLPGCSIQSDTTRIQFLTNFSGDDTLEPEESTNYTLGVVWTPQSIIGLSMSLDHFWIDQENVVDASPQTLLNENAYFYAYSDLVERDSMGNIRRITAPFINIGERNIKGLDFASRYQWISAKGGLLSLSLNASYLYEYLNQVSDNSPKKDLAGTYSDAATEGHGSIPEWKVNTGLVWTQNAYELSYNVNYISSLKEKIPQSNSTRTIDPWLTHDLQLSYYTPFYAGLHLSLGIDNVLDEEPPFASAAFNDSFDARTYDIKGRYWYFRLSQSF